MTTDDHTGTNWNFLGTRACYDRVRDMERRNVIVPLVGDFAGPKTLRAMAANLKQHHAPCRYFISRTSSSTFSRSLASGLPIWTISKLFPSIQKAPLMGLLDRNHIARAYETLTEAMG